MKLIQPLSMGLVLAAFASCAHTAPPQDLVNARTAYDRASHGPAGRLAAADLRSAKETLDTAERYYAMDDSQEKTAALAYTAVRRTELAEARARSVEQTQQKNQTVATQQLTATSNAQLTSAELTRAKSQMAMDGQQLQTERRRADEADKRALQATADLAKFAAVKQESRGLVITLSGSVLFASAKSDLLPGAREKLTTVASSLTKQDPDSKLVVEGHTDSQGGADYNQALSQRRAAAVRDYLVSQGIAGDRVTAQGFGSTRSVADNSGAEGRANNRRVEIVVQSK